MLKRFISILLTVVMVSTLGGGMNFGQNVEVKAATAGITNGATYTIVSAYNGKAITQTDLSTFYANCVVWNTDAMSDLARWTLKETGDYYNITNVVSGKSIKITGKNNGDNMDLNGNDNSDNYRWKLVPITSGTYSGCYYIVSAVKNDNGEEEYAEIISDDDKKDKDGAQVRLWTKAKSVDYEPRQIWRIEKSDAENSSFTEAMADKALEAFKSKYYVKNSTTGYDSLGGGFWGIAEVMEAMLDGYETTGKPIYRDMFQNTYKDFIARNGDYWSNNDFNDDIAWAVLDSVRAYLLFGDQSYLDIAKKNWDFMYKRGTEGRTDGLIRWSHENGRGDGTTSCINGPATVGACYLAIATGDDSYYTKAKRVFDAWRNSSLYVREGDDAGHVWDSAGNAWRSTYNQGTFLGAAIMLYEKYGTQQYYDDACNVMANTVKNLCYNNILKEENTNSGDLSGMRGILMRYMRKFIVDFNKGEYLSFFKDNARVAWMNSNSKGIMQCSWQNKASEDATWDSFAAYNAISLMANMPTYADNLQRDAYSNIEAEDLDYCKGLISENSGGTSGGRSLGGVKNGNYAAYYNIDFGETGASKLTFKYSRETEKEDANGTLEFRLGSTTGPLIAKASIENTGTWQNWKEVTIDTARITGVQNVYIVFKSDTPHVCNFDYFKFTKATKDNQGYFFLKSDASNQYAMCKNGSSDTTIVATSDNRDEWEQFKIIKNDDGTVSFKSLVSGKYICMVSEGAYLTASTSAIYNGEKFVIERYAEDTSKNKQFAIRSIANGKYLCVDPNGDKAVLSTSTTIGGLGETFHMETVNGEWIVPDGTVLADSAYRDAFSKIEAERTDDYNGTINYDTYLGNTNDGEWARYDSVRFTKTAKSIIMNYSVRGKIATGKVSLYLDSLDTTPVGELYLTETAEDSWDTYVEKKFALEKEISAGVHKVYLKFTPDSGKTYVGNIDYFLFSEEPTTVAPPTTVKPTTVAPTTEASTTEAPTTVAPTTEVPTTVAPTTEVPTTVAPTTEVPTTVAPTTVAPTTVAPTTVAPTTEAPTIETPTTVAPTTEAPTTMASTTQSKTSTEAIGEGSDVGKVNRKILNCKNDKDLAGSTFGKLCVKVKKSKKKAISLTWKKIQVAKTYVIYGAKCGTSYKKIATVHSKTFTNKKLRKGTYYKYMVVALNEKNKVVAISKLIHVATKGGKVGNCKKLKVNKSKVNLKQGRKFKLKVKQIAESKKVKLKKHRKTAFESDNQDVAVVSKKGVITAKKKGKCSVYVYAQNGVYKRVKVTVK
ncbi:MAG: glycoside hydrolase family 76 protein [Eubacterium sp.]